MPVIAKFMSAKLPLQKTSIYESVSWNIWHIFGFSVLQDMNNFSCCLTIVLLCLFPIWYQCWCSSSFLNHWQKRCAIAVVVGFLCVFLQNTRLHVFKIQAKKKPPFEKTIFSFAFFSKCKWNFTFFLKCKSKFAFCFAFFYIFFVFLTI